MTRTTALAIAICLFVTIVGCDKENKPTPYTNQGPNSSQVPPGQPGPNGAPNGNNPNIPQMPVPPSQNPEGPAIGPNPVGQPNTLDMPTRPGPALADPRVQPQLPVAPPNGITLPPPPADWQLEIYGRNEYRNPSIELIYPYFRYQRCQHTGNYFLDHELAHEEARWIVQNRIDFRLYHQSLNYFSRMKICTPRGEVWAFPGRQAILVTHDVLRRRPDFNLQEFDRHYRHVIREGARGRVAIQEALRRMDRCYHDLDIEVIIRW